ncbi:ABC transporter ATP-binding protein [Hoeflea sp. AS60]|uniref:ABC transporter ATP-binding protein n=1 Tax=Hoeflea sp. AS60 TaxID=3135780 RepID=UPI00317FA25E
MTKTANLSLKALSKRFGETMAVRDLSLDIPASSYVVLLGPSGSGKTTLLSMLGGFTAPTSGQIFLDDDDITLMQPAQRPTATVFQDYALFPHLSVGDNVAFGLSVRKVAKAEAARRVAEALDMVGLKGFEKRKISEASGGQRQRIALARALVIDPAILLLDEPLGALDLNLRRQMQDELRALQKRERRTFVHVTHDQEEAMAIADTIVIMKDGVIEDAGPPQDVYSHPRSRFSAQFMGESNILDADISEGMAETALGRFPVVGKGTAAVAIRPENFTVTPGEGAVSLGMAALEEVVFQGSFVRLSARIGNVEIRLRVPPADISGSGQQVEVFLKRGGAAALQS